MWPDVDRIWTDFGGMAFTPGRLLCKVVRAQCFRVGAGAESHVTCR